MTLLKRGYSKVNKKKKFTKFLAVLNHLSQGKIIVYVNTGFV